MNRNNIYAIDHYRLVEWLTPNKIKAPAVTAFLKAMCFNLLLIYNTFVIYRKQKLYELMITSQTCYLRRLLNDRFDFADRGIYIKDGLDKPPFYIFKRAELKQKYIRRRSEQKPIHIYTNGESGDIKDDFIVYVPMQVVFNEAEMTSLIKVYKLAGTKFKIQTI